MADNAAKVSKELVKLIDEGYDIVALTASCGLMLKFEWALIAPTIADVKKVADATFDIDEYVVDIARKEGLPHGLKPLPEGVTVHLACHARAQNMGPKAAEMLKLIPDTPVDVIERCSGHGGTFGVVKPTHDVGGESRPAGVPRRQHPDSAAISCRTARWRRSISFITPKRRRANRNIPSRSWRAPFGLMED